MKITSRLLVVLAGVVLLYGCPFSSEYPIDEPSVKVDKSYFGLWEQRSLNHDEKNLYRVYQKSEFTYKIIENIKGNDKDTIGMEGHISQINNTLFLNCQFLPFFYCLYKVEKEANKLVLTEVRNDTTKRYSSSAEVKDYVIQNMDKSNFYGEKLVCQKR